MKRSARNAAKLNVKMSNKELDSQVDKQTLDPEIVSQIFDEFDDVSSSMISKLEEDINWDDGDELVLYLRLKRMSKRSSALDKIVPDRVCPICKNIESRDSHWRIDRFHSNAICWGCFKSNHNFRITNSKFYLGYDEWEIISLMNKIFEFPKVRYKVKGRNLQKIRGMLGIQQAKLARRLCVTPMAINKLEDGIIHTIEGEKAVECMKMFREFFIVRLKELGYSSEELQQYEYKKPEIEEIMG